MQFKELDKKALKIRAEEELRRRLKVVVEAAFEAKEASTNEESKAENKYDTRGLEASYLAAGQAQRAADLQKSLYYLEQFEALGAADKVQLGSLVQLLVDGEEEKIFFILPIGGILLQEGDLSVQTIALDAPLGKLVHKKQPGDYFDFKQREYEVVAVK